MKTRNLNPRADAYVVALRMLARRELSEAQIRQRLARKGYDPDAVDAAVERLRQERAVDDRRVAEAIAHTAAVVHRRGRLRVRRQIEQAGIAATTGREAIEAVFGTLDEDGLLEDLIGRRLRGREGAADERELARLFRYLVGRGFEPDRVMAALRKRRS